jgi:polyhydroxybutyrate depolymerase
MRVRRIVQCLGRGALYCGLILLLADLSAGQSTIQVNAGRGNVNVWIPSSYDPQMPMPLIMALHGYSANGPIFESVIQFEPLSEQYGFIYLHPSGTLDTTGFRFWNGTDACCDFYGSGIDDSGYLRSLIEQVELQLNVDPRRIHLFGHSNGGFMSYRMACDHADLIASIASLAGATYLDPLLCTPTEPVHVLQIHGTADTVILYNGGQVSVPGAGVYPGAIQTVEQWVSSNGCSPGFVTLPALDLDAGLPGFETTVRSYASGCAESGSAELWTIVGGSHLPMMSADFSPAVVEFLLAHPKPALFRRGDDNGDGSVDIGDPIHNLGYLFGTGASICLDAQDTNDDGSVDIGDPVYHLSFQFTGGPMPPAPFGTCGVDPTDDTLNANCSEYPGCP